jgi:SAM-dependent methyltransferase
MIDDERRKIADDRNVIRQYENQDLDDLLTAWAAASEIAHPFLTKEFLASERENIPNLYLPNAETWVYEDDGQVVGFIALIGSEVGAIFVHPSHQRKGVGHRLMGKAKEIREELEVEVFVNNAIGRAFYAKYGFETVAEKVHEQTGFDLLRLRLPSSERVCSVTEPTDTQMALVFSFYEGVERKGPGSEESTLKALNLLDGLPINPRIVEFGCGAGVATIALARSTPCHITAVDIHQQFLDELDRSAVRTVVKDRITTLKADMGNPPFPDESFDVVWSEGAIYNIGFEQGLRRWRRLLRTGGYVAVSEAVWLTENPPQRAKEFWEAEYPAMTSVEENLSKFSATGFTPVSHFILPPTDWENYYLPLQSHLAEFQASHTDTAAAESLVKGVHREVDIWKDFGTTFGYAFFVGRAV